MESLSEVLQLRFTKNPNYVATALKSHGSLLAQDLARSELKKPCDTRENKKQNVTAYSVFNRYASVPSEVAHSDAAYSSVRTTYLCVDVQPLDERRDRKGNYCDYPLQRYLLLAH